MAHVFNLILLKIYVVIYACKDLCFVRQSSLCTPCIVCCVENGKLFKEHEVNHWLNGSSWNEQFYAIFREVNVCVWLLANEWYGVEREKWVAAGVADGKSCARCIQMIWRLECLFTVKYRTTWFFDKNDMKITHTQETERDTFMWCIYRTSIC